MGTVLPQQLLAKKPRPRAITLERHSLDTSEAAGQLFRLDRRWGQAWCRLFRLAPEQHARFLLHLQVAGLLHDLGKANADFLARVQGQSKSAQMVRHEHLSALLLHLPGIRSWLSAQGRLDPDVLTGAVLSHHFKASSKAGDFMWCRQHRSGTVGLFFHHEEVQRVLLRVAEVARLNCPPTLAPSTWPDTSWERSYESARKAADVFRADLRKNAPRQRLLLATKAGLIAADTVASALVREELDIRHWIDDVVHKEPIGPEEISSKILRPRITQLSRKRPLKFHAFQDAAATLGSRALLLAACGTGKTIAA